MSTSCGLDGHIQSLSQTLAQPWLRRREYTKLKSLTEGIVDAMYKYKEYMDQKNEQVKAAHANQSAIRMVSDTLEVFTLEASTGPVSLKYLCSSC